MEGWQGKTRSRPNYVIVVASNADPEPIRSNFSLLGEVYLAEKLRKFCGEIEPSELSRGNDAGNNRKA